jgi:hypothetical protein
MVMRLLPLPALGRGQDAGSPGYLFIMVGMETGETGRTQSPTSDIEIPIPGANI